VLGLSGTLVSTGALAAIINRRRRRR
jgi:hypothetical protein